MNHLIYSVNKTTLDVTVGGPFVSVPLKVLRMKLQLLLDLALHQKTHVGVCCREAVAHINLLVGLLCCNTKIATLLNLHTAHIYWRVFGRINASILLIERALVDFQNYFNQKKSD